MKAIIGNIVSLVTEPKESNTEHWFDLFLIASGFLGLLLFLVKIDSMLYSYLTN